MLGEDVSTPLAFCPTPALTECFRSLFPNLDQLSHFPALTQRFSFSIMPGLTLASGGLNVLCCPRPIRNSNIASLQSLDNIDFHLVCRGGGDIFGTGLWVFSYRMCNFFDAEGNAGVCKSPVNSSQTSFQPESKMKHLFLLSIRH